MFGFEQRGLKNYPVIGGVVVLEEHAAVVVEAAQTLSADKSERVEARRESAALGKWEHLVRSAVNREELGRKYGH